MSKKKPVILIVEDEEDMLLGVRHNLQFEGYDTLEAHNGFDGLEMATRDVVDLILLDVMLPKIDGFEVLRRLRERGIQTPVIVLTSKGQETDKLEGFSSGADDYVTKPFSIQELLARIQAVLGRSRRGNEPSGVFQFEDFTLDFQQQTVTQNNQSLTLALKEFEILQLLVENSGEIVSRERMLQEVWGYSPDNFPETRTVDNHIAKLRNKIGSQYIETVPKRGYRFRPPSTL